MEAYERQDLWYAEQAEKLLRPVYHDVRRFNWTILIRFKDQWASPYYLYLMVGWGQWKASIVRQEQDGAYRFVNSLGPQSFWQILNRFHDQLELKRPSPQGEWPCVTDPEQP